MFAGFSNKLTIMQLGCIQAIGMFVIDKDPTGCVNQKINFFSDYTTTLFFTGDLQTDEQIQNRFLDVSRQMSYEQVIRTIRDFDFSLKWDLTAFLMVLIHYDRAPKKQEWQFLKKVIMEADLPKMPLGVAANAMVVHMGIPDLKNVIYNQGFFESFLF